MNFIKDISVLPIRDYNPYPPIRFFVVCVWGVGGGGSALNILIIPNNLISGLIISLFFDERNIFL